MSDSGCTGTLVLSIDLELDLELHAAPLGRRLDEVRATLIRLTSEAGIPATWAVADPMLSAASDSILTANCGHEIAVLGDRAWLGPGCGRERLTRELARRFSTPRKAGIPVSTLVLRNLEDLTNLDLLVGQGVTAVCGPPSNHPAPRFTHPPTRFGLWQPPVAWRPSLRSHWALPAGWHVHREIKRAMRQKSMLHVRLDATRLVSATDQTFIAIGSILRHASAKREAGHLTVHTIAQLASQALGNRAAHPSRSILRPAA